MRARIASYRRDPIALDDRQDPVIGCRILTQPFFWPKELWLPVPESWSPNIVTGKGFNAKEGDGQYLWSAVTDRLNSVPEIRNTEPIMAERFGNPTLIKPRLGQGAFRLTITDNYERRCAVSGEKTLPISGDRCSLCSVCHNKRPHRQNDVSKDRCCDRGKYFAGGRHDWFA
ncbi:hypothetical protein [Rhizobium sp. BK376]|uniref:hypothetical protein n=1 Tax=Rhizobium sp. BK376 TaxID=2512149 RepID=UPI0010DB4297|nr:hypothetical protein [Rhizobium sp. BK376]TCR71820.1 hypothetical protein EV561_1312 [Rhizobium sp. BK376]